MAEPRITLYHFEECPYCEKVRRTLRLLGIEYESHIVDPKDRSEVKKISGQHLVPVIVDGETMVYDSTAIIEYLDEQYGADRNIIPAKLSFRGEAYILNRFAEEAWGELTYRAQLGLDPDGEDLDEPGRKALQEAINREASILEEFFDGRNYAVGDTISLADIALSSFISRLSGFSDFGIPGSFETLRAWYERIEDEVGEPAVTE